MSGTHTKLSYTPARMKQAARNRVQTESFLELLVQMAGLVFASVLHPPEL